MATVSEIIKKREADIATCETTGRQERTQLKLATISIAENLKNIVTKGFNWDYARALEIDNKEHLCKFTAERTADKDFAIREVELQVENMGLSGSYRGASTRAANAEREVRSLRTILNRLLGGQ